MSLFFDPPASSRQLAVPNDAFRKPSNLKQPPRPRDDIDEYLSSDLELSFASNMSLDSPHEEPPNLPNPRDSDVLMDMSPAPIRSSSPPGLNAKPLLTKARSLSAQRLFGRDVSNDKVLTSDDQMPLRDESTNNQDKQAQRPSVPVEWLLPTGNDKFDELPEPFSPGSEGGMDIDSSFAPPSSPELEFEPDEAFILSPLCPSVDPNGGFKDLFREASPPPAGAPKKRRSLSPATVLRFDDGIASSSPAPPSSPTVRKFERIASAPLGRIGRPDFGVAIPKGINKLEVDTKPSKSRPSFPTEGALSAYPILSRADDETKAISVAPVPRRALSQAAMLSMDDTPFSDADDSFDMEGSGGFDMMSPSQPRSKRQGAKSASPFGGTKGQKIGADGMHDEVEASPATRWINNAIPPFGDNEAHGKILPCHRVQQDGLMRITPQTLDALLDGAYDKVVTEYLIIDCRFDYEYAGGHISGAVNVNTAVAVEEFLLNSAAAKPKPCISGDGTKKTVLVFHCEFSAQRAPTFAKHLRSRDRALNQHCYPRVHYPEVYVLEGGYSAYFSRSSARCQPCGYVSMDDPRYTRERRGEIEQFRKSKFGRTKSWAYGEVGRGGGLFGEKGGGGGLKRHTAPAVQLFNSKGKGKGLGGEEKDGGKGNGKRRGGSLGGLATLVEDGGFSSGEGEGDDELGGLGSPCPPAGKGKVAPRGKVLGGRKPLARAETYGGRLVFG